MECTQHAPQCSTLQSTVIRLGPVCRAILALLPCVTPYWLRALAATSGTGLVPFCGGVCTTDSDDVSFTTDVAFDLAEKATREALAASDASSDERPKSLWTLLLA